MLLSSALDFVNLCSLERFLVRDAAFFTWMLCLFMVAVMHRFLYHFSRRLFKTSLSARTIKALRRTETGKIWMKIKAVLKASKGFLKAKNIIEILWGDLWFVMEFSEGSNHRSL